MFQSPDLPFDVLHLILQYDGRIKYSHKKGVFVNIIHRNDERYEIVTSVIKKKLDIIQQIEKGLDYYVDIWIEYKNLGLIYCGDWLYKFKIYHNCLYDSA